MAALEKGPQHKNPHWAPWQRSREAIKSKSIYYTTALTQFQLYHHFGNSEHSPFFIRLWRVKNDKLGCHNHLIPNNIQMTVNDNLNQPL